MDESKIIVSKKKSVNEKAKTSKDMVASKAANHVDDRYGICFVDLFACSITLL